MKVAIIPARGGSKRIPRKNIKLFLGKPIIHYSIQAAKRTGLFDKIICSTDDEEIAHVARTEGAETPFIRPKHLADDYAPTAPVLLHAVEWLENTGIDISHVCCIYPAAPLIQPKYIAEGYDSLIVHKATSAFPVTTHPSSVLRSLLINKNNRLEMFWPEYELTRSNDLPQAYNDAAQFYWLDKIKFLTEKRIFSEDSIPINLPRHLVQDIDTPEDWEFAEWLFTTNHNLKNS